MIRAPFGPGKAAARWQKIDVAVVQAIRPLSDASLPTMCQVVAINHERVRRVVALSGG
jgi:hypothetical protein